MYSNLEPYMSVVTHGYNGFLATIEEEWINHLIQLIENPDLRETIGSNAQKTLKEKWLLSNNAYLWLEAYSQAFEKVGSHNQNIHLSRLIRRIDDQMFEYQNNLRWDYKQAMEQIHRLDSQLIEIQNSTLWLLLRKLWKIRTYLVPPMSIREEILSRIKRMFVKER